MTGRDRWIESVLHTGDMTVADSKMLVMLTVRGKGDASDVRRSQRAKLFIGLG